jgi:hypothetical protein
MKKATKKVTQNPITSIFGILAIVAGLAPIWAPPQISAKIQTTAAVLTGGGLLAAQDSKQRQAK